MRTPGARAPEPQDPYDPYDPQGAGGGDDESAPVFSHLVADFVGVPPGYLRDATMLSGLLIAAAGAAGFTVVGAPIVRQLPHDGVAGLMLVDGCHMSVHAFPERQLLLLDVLALATHDGRKALDVFARRIPAREIRSDQRGRGRA